MWILYCIFNHRKNKLTFFSVFSSYEDPLNLGKGWVIESLSEKDERVNYPTQNVYAQTSTTTTTMKKRRLVWKHDGSSSPLFIDHCCRKWLQSSARVKQFPDQTKQNKTKTHIRGKSTHKSCLLKTKTKSCNFSVISGPLKTIKLTFENIKSQLQERQSVTVENNLKYAVCVHEVLTAEKVFADNKKSILHFFICRWEIWRSCVQTDRLSQKCWR